MTDIWTQFRNHRNMSAKLVNASKTNTCKAILGEL